MTTLPFWLISIRGAFDGPTYRWGLFGPGGNGTGDDYWVPALGVVGAVVVLTLAGGMGLMAVTGKRLRVASPPDTRLAQRGLRRRFPSSGKTA